MKQGYTILKCFKIRWLTAIVLEAMATAWMAMSMVGFMTYYFDLSSKEWLPAFVFALIFISRFFYKKGHQVNHKTVAQYLDVHDSDLENSSTVLWKEEHDNLLLKLQKEKLIQLLAARQSAWKVPVSYRNILLYTVLGTLCFVASFYLPTSSNRIQNPVLNELISDSSRMKANHELIKIVKSSLIVTPPSYTKKSKETLFVADVDVLENSYLKWNVHLNASADHLCLIFQTKDTVYLKVDGSSYSYLKAFSGSSFYQIMIKNKEQIWLTDFYKINVQKDLAPVIEVQGLEERTEYDIYYHKSVPIHINISDDFGVSEAYLVATVSRGKGESVKFREERLNFSNKINGQKRLELDYQINFGSLKMEAGDELYFYVQAIDNRQPEFNTARSDMFFLSLKDTTQLVTFIEGGLAVDLMPEYFRSQRQIIIDTEELLAERKHLDVKTYQARSNALANDQKILRLRYGQFLGEEFESNIGPNALENLKSYYLSQSESDKTETDTELKKKVSKMFGLQLSEGHYVGDGHNHDDEALKEHDRVGNASNPEMSGQQEALDLLQPYIHAHDETEEASFFDEALKAKLKAALVQMWEAELRLRLYQPKDALPFENQALKLIKEIQQDSRLYVERVGFEAPPLKEDKRLSGKLKDVPQQRKTASIEPEQSLKPIEDALYWVNQKWLMDSLQLDKADQDQLNALAAFISKLAIEEPGKAYLKTLKVIKELQSVGASKQSLRANLRLLNQYLHTILGQPEAKPILRKNMMFDIRQNYLQSLQKK